MWCLSRSDFALTVSRCKGQNGKRFRGDSPTPSNARLGSILVGFVFLLDLCRSRNSTFGVDGVMGFFPWGFSLGVFPFCDSVTGCLFSLTCGVHLPNF